MRINELKNKFYVLKTGPRWPGKPMYLENYQAINIEDEQDMKAAGCRLENTSNRSKYRSNISSKVY